ncbi:MAG TPA: putative metal-dependent hydrolase, partial [Bacteroidota bacterium]|nr:putative metal-dependent hydrolase [Bacteroidota bacterium]
MNDPRYPIGKFEPPAEYTAAGRRIFIDQIYEMPLLLRKALEGLTDEQLDTPYRDGGWSLRQVVHHLADSHLNAYMRFKLAVTEDTPTIRPYDEKAWAGLEDSLRADVEVSLVLLRSLHQRWVIFLKSLSDEQFSRTYVHPENGPGIVDRLLALYAWHGRHH